MPKQSPKTVRSGTQKTTPKKSTTKPASTPKVVPKTSPRTPKASPKAKEAKETLAKIAATNPKASPKGKTTTPKGKVTPKVSPKTTPKVSPKASPKPTKVAPLNADASTNLFDTPRSSRSQKQTPSPKAAVTSARQPKASPTTKVSPKGKATPPAKVTPPTKATTASPKGKATTASPKQAPKVATKPSPKGKATNASPKQAPKVATKPSPKGKTTSAKASPKGRKAPPKSTKKPVREDSSSEEDFKTGELIDAEWGDDGLFYSARVVKVNRLKSGTTYDVEFTQDGILRKKLTRDQIQSYSEDSDEPTRHRSKVSIDDQEYVDGYVPIPEEDATVESDSTDEPRRRGRQPAKKQAPKRKRVATETVAEKKRKVHTGLDNLTQKQLVTLVNQVCNQNPKILDAVLDKIPEKKLQSKNRK